MLTSDRLKALFDYNPCTGIFIRKVTLGRGIAGTAITKTTRYGYVQFQVDGHSYMAHRLAFLYMTGTWPNQILDHKNRIRSDNSWENIRECTYQQNNRNCITKTTSSRFKGMHRKPNGRFEVRIRAEGIQHLLGVFKNDVEAAYAYDMASIKFHGEFGTRNFLPLA